MRLHICGKTAPIVSELVDALNKIAEVNETTSAIIVTGSISQRVFPIKLLLLYHSSLPELISLEDKIPDKLAWTKIAERLRKRNKPKIKHRLPPKNFSPRK